MKRSMICYNFTATLQGNSSTNTHLHYVLGIHTTVCPAHGENIDIVNVATNAQQSRQVFFSKLRSRLQSRCFKEFGPSSGPR